MGGGLWLPWLAPNAPSNRNLSAVDAEVRRGTVRTLTHSFIRTRTRSKSTWAGQGIASHRIALHRSSQVARLPVVPQ